MEFDPDTRPLGSKYVSGEWYNGKSHTFKTM